MLNQDWSPKAMRTARKCKGDEKRKGEKRWDYGGGGAPKNRETQ